MNFTQALYSREVGKQKALNPWKDYSPEMKKALDRSLNKIIDVTATLKQAVWVTKKWADIELAVSSLLARILDTTNPDQMFVVTPQRKNEREMFIFLGGVEMLLQLFSPPLLKIDDRRSIQQRSDMWNEVLVILREIAYAVPSSSEKMFGCEQIIQLFGMLRHHSTFENTINLIEEVLSLRPETFNLASIPNFYELVSKFSARQLAHFCRILSLVLFEPEDRHIMEGSHVLRSLELLQLRRDRMVKIGSIVERNQSLVIGMPGFLSHLVQVLSIVTYGPRLADLLRYNIATQNPIPPELLQIIVGNSGAAEWDVLRELDDIVRAKSANASRDTACAGASPSAAARSGKASGVPSAREVDAAESAAVRSEILGVFSSYSRTMDMGSLIGIMNQAQALGLTNLSRRTATRTSVRDAKRQLTFQAVLLVPHLVELIFVICTLLAGRRKISVQNQLCSLGLGGILVKLFDQMSWEDPPFSGPNPLEHAHGPSCDCNPESALRVQLLRLVHNYYDRDFMGSSVKADLLTAEEAEALAEHPSVAMARGLYIAPEHHGLISRIMNVLQKEGPESIYKFWLSSCLEAFMRGSGPKEQLFISRGGVLAHTAKAIVEAGQRSSTTLQTSFDLLGELIKCNPHSIQMLEESLDGNNLSLFMDVVMSNLVDSNVFLRFLYLSMDSITAAQYVDACWDAGRIESGLIYSDHCSQSALSASSCNECDSALPSALGALPNNTLSLKSGYISHSWIHFAPALLVDSEDMMARESESRVTRRIAIKHSPAPDSARHATSSEESRRPSGPLGSLTSMLGGLLGLPAQLLSARPPARGDDSSDDDDAASSPSDEGLDFPSLVRDLGIEDIDVDDDGDYHSPRQPASTATSITEAISSSYSLPPAFSSLSSAPASAPASSLASSLKGASLSSEIDGVAGWPTRAGANPQIDVKAKHVPDAFATSPMGPWILPLQLYQLPLLLLKNRERVLYKLLSTISIRTINHENICCLNTAIIISVLSHAQCQLAGVLASLRKLADEDGMSDLHVQQGAAAVELVAAEATEVGVSTGATDSRRHLLMHNFRELLWYWREYYLRRGRDRLSLEFSCHLPFSRWLYVVDLMCKDDGTPCSLLQYTPSLPRSPYSTASRYHSSAAQDLVRF